MKPFIIYFFTLFMLFSQLTGANQSESFDTLFNLASEYLKQGKTNKAINYYQQAIAVNNTNPQANFNLGLALIIKNKISDAIPFLERAIELKPDYIKAHTHLGDCFIKSKKIMQGIQHLYTATFYDPSYFDAYKKLACALILLDQFGRS